MKLPAKAIAILKLTLTLIVIGFIVWRLRHDFVGFSMHDLAFDPGMLALAQTVFVLYLGGGALIWFLLTVKNGVAIPLWQTISTWCYSMMGKYVPGKALLWGIRLYQYTQLKPGVNVVALCKCFVLEYLGGVAAGLILILASLAVVELDSVSSRMRIAALVLLAVSLMGIHPRVLGLLAKTAGRRLGLEDAGLSLRVIDVATVVVLSGLNWLVLGTSIFILARSFHPALDGSQWLYVTVSYTFAGLVGFLAIFAPSGIGVREGVLIASLAQIMPVQAATVIAVAARLISTIGESGTVLIVWLTNRVRRARQG